MKPNEIFDIDYNDNEKFENALNKMSRKEMMEAILYAWVVISKYTTRKEKNDA